MRNALIVVVTVNLALSAVPLWPALLLLLVAVATVKGA